MKMTRIMEKGFIFSVLILFCVVFTSCNASQENIAKGKLVKTLSSIESDGWSVDGLTDGEKGGKGWSSKAYSQHANRIFFPAVPAFPQEEPFYDQSVPKPTFSDIRYGAHERHMLDFWKAESNSLTPLVFVIHGGGWDGGEKEWVYRSVVVQQLLDAGISVATINYRLIKHAEEEGITPPVKAPMYDAARALQFLRSKAGEWNIDKKRIAAVGESAGSCTSLWLAYHDDLADLKSKDPVSRESSRIWCAAVLAAQTTLDPKQMKEWTPNSWYGGHAFGRRIFEQFLAARDSILPWITEYSPYALVSSDDPPVYLYYTSPPSIGQSQEDPTHTANFGVKLQERCEKAGIKCELVYPDAPGVKYETAMDYLIATLGSCSTDSVVCNSQDLLPIPDKLVVLTVDDGSLSDFTYTAPLLKKYGFGATFFISSNSFLGYPGIDERRMSWNQIKQLDEDGFEIGNHSTSHPTFTGLTQEQTLSEIEGMEKECLARGITKPVSFAYPGGHVSDDHFTVFEQKGYEFIRRTTNPESSNMETGSRGSVYEPGRDHPYAIPSTLFLGKGIDIEDLGWAVNQAKDGKICVICLHGVPDVHPQITVSPAEFDTYMRFLKDEGCTVIAQRDLAKYVDPSSTPKDVFGVIYSRLCTRPCDLKCENEFDPLDLDSQQPHLSWAFKSLRQDRKQTAYQILLASSEDKLNDDFGDLWDSGKVLSDQNANVVYSGNGLSSGKKYFWKVRCWNEPGEPGVYESEEFYDTEVLAALRSVLVSEYSSTASFTTGLFSKWE